MSNKKEFEIPSFCKYGQNLFSWTDNQLPDEKTKSLLKNDIVYEFLLFLINTKSVLPRKNNYWIWGTSSNNALDHIKKEFKFTETEELLQFLVQKGIFIIHPEYRMEYVYDATTGTNVLQHEETPQIYLTPKSIYLINIIKKLINL